MIERRKIFILGVVITAIATLGCGPDKAVTSDMATITLKVGSTDPGLINILIDATDQFGNHGTTAETGLPYPLNVKRKSPYTHTIYIQPGIIVTATITAILDSKNKDEVLSCEVFGPTGQSADKLVMKGNQAVNCRYVSGVPGVEPFKKPPQ